MESVITAELYSHGARISGYTKDTLYKMQRFLDTLLLREPTKVQGRMVMVTKKKYYGMTEDGTSIFIHRNSYPALVAHLANLGIRQDRINEIHIPVPKAEPSQFIVQSKFTAHEYQERIKEDILRPHLRSARVDLQTGKGKSLANGTPVKVPGGWKAIDELVVGDTVTGRDGKPTKVIGVYPQQTKPLYEVVFRDGRSVKVCGEHLWKVYYVNTTPAKRWRVVNTHEVMRLINMPNPRVYIPLCESEEGEDIDLPLDPYTLGALLGDGGMSAKAAVLTSVDQEIFDRVASAFPEGITFSDRDAISKAIVQLGEKGNMYTSTLASLGLMGKKSEEKFIPAIYMDASTEQRWALLQGLMDTDGTVNTTESGGSITYCSTSYKLASDVRRLVRSLGGQAKISSRVPQYTYQGVKKDGLTAYNVNIRVKTPSKLFSISRKKERTNDDNQYAKDLKLQITAVNPVGNGESTCIAVDNEDKLFVTKDYIVTHNTFTSLYTTATIAQRLVVMVPPKYFGIWQEALEDVYEDMQTRWVTVSGSAELQAVIDRGIQDDLDGIDVIIISNVTYRAYLDTFERLGDKIHTVGYNAPPPRFHEAVKAGVQINDEIQEDPGLLFRTDMYTNIGKQIYLSATPYTGNAYVTKMIDLMLPPETACRLPEWDMYINAVGVLYSEPDIRSKDYLTPFKNTYNHARYETVMMKSKKRLLAYNTMVARIIQKQFLDDKQPEQKCLVLCATVEFIKQLVAFLKEKFPDQQINEHVSGSPFERLQINDITVSTIKSSGTGVDIKNLREVILCQATDSKKDNIQILGRLRKLKLYPDVTPRLTFLACQHIPQHCTYCRNKKDHFLGKALNMTMRRYG